VEDNGKTREELLEEINTLKARIAEFESWEHKCKASESELKKAQEELEIETWGLAKTNEAIKYLYQELDKKNRELQTLDLLKTEFINTASHELRTPLTIIREAISQVLDGLHGQINPDQKEYLSLCLNDVDRLQHLINDLLDISKLESGKFKLMKERVDIVDLVKNVSASFYSKAANIGLELRESFHQSESWAFVDRDSIKRVFTNIIGNAIKFTDLGSIEISITETPTHIECAVSDTGRGIAGEDLPRLFTKFEQFGELKGSGEEKGTGLGLNISKSIIELHRGEIWAESNLNKGTTINFTLPKYTEKEIRRESLYEELSQALPHKESLTLLVFGVGDFDSFRMIAGEAKTHTFMQQLEKLVRQSIRVDIDTAINNGRVIFVLLPDIRKKKAQEVTETIHRYIEKNLTGEGEWEKVQIFTRLVNYPEDCASAEDMLAKVDSDV